MGVPHETPKKINSAGPPASVTLYQGSCSDAAAGRGGQAGRRTDSGELPPADFVAIQNLLFSASKYTSVNGLMMVKSLLKFDPGCSHCACPLEIWNKYC